MQHVIHRIRAHNAASRVLGRRARAGRVPKPVPPKAIEANYAGQLIAIVHVIKPSIDALLREMPGLLDSASAARGDVRHDVGEMSRMRAAFEQARTALHHATNIGVIESISRRYAQTTSVFQHAQLARQVKAAIGIDITTADRRIPAMIEHFVGENAALIKSLGNRTVDDIEKVVSRAFTTGARAEDVAGDVADRYGISERHARLIARDQIGSLNGQINAARQQEIGVTRGIWRTAGDDRVRPEHEALDGVEFDIDDPPDGELPGEPVCCRCYLEPVFAGLLGEADDT
jgi:SPP1 gp7 family putative phage head morphogenesis protein